MKHLFHLYMCGVLNISKTLQNLVCICLVSETGAEAFTLKSIIKIKL